MRTPSILVFAALFAFVLSACQEGKRKESASNTVVERSTQETDDLERELVALGFVVDGPNPSDDKTSVVLPPRSVKPGSEARIRSRALLERYVTSAKKILGLADEKVVVFNQKSDLVRKYQRVCKYLGLLYASTDMTGENSPGHTYDVDEAEMNARFARTSDSMRALGDVGYTIDCIPGCSARVSKNLKIETLRKVSSRSNKIIEDMIRSKTLMERNAYFKLQGLRIYADNAEAIAGAYYSVKAAADAEIERRERR